MSKVLVGVSGGVDSSVSLHLLQKQGYEVEGVIFKQVNVESPDDDAVCCSASAVEEAIEVGRQLGVRVHPMDLRRKFKDLVIDPTIKAFTDGLTPSPCLTCNSKLRSVELDRVRWLTNSDYFATGHYFRVLNGEVYRGADPTKDQSYMVALVPKDFFKRWLTPVGDLLKSEVRKIADDLDLETAHNPDSQDLCFRHLLPKFTREVVEDGKVIGEHTGRPTVGQKKRFSGKHVLKILPDEIHVSNEPPLVDRITLESCNWLVSEADTPEVFDVQPRSHGEIVLGRFIKGASNITEIEVATPGIFAPGQIAAIYNGNHLLGGGIIRR